MSRGDRKEAIYLDDWDRQLFLEVTALAVQRYDLCILSYCLMRNHYHFVLQTREPNLSRAMRHINGVYTQKYNRRHDTCGHVFQGRFTAHLIAKDAYLMEACRYVELNPVRAQLVQSADEWQWSSYRARTGLAPCPSWLGEADFLHAGSATAADHHQRHAHFIAQAKS
jgi:REP element-mobilizing transposase RayT